MRNTGEYFLAHMLLLFAAMMVTGTLLAGYEAIGWKGTNGITFGASVQILLCLVLGVMLDKSYPQNGTYLLATSFFTSSLVGTCLIVFELAKYGRPLPSESVYGLILAWVTGTISSLGVSIWARAKWHESIEKAKRSFPPRAVSNS